MSNHRKPIASHWNPLPICAGLELSSPQSGGTQQRFDLNADLNFGRQPLSGEDVSFRLGVKTGFLRVRLNRCRIVGTRFAMRDQSATFQREVKREETESSATKREGSAAAKLGFNRSGLKGDAEVGGGASGTRSRERSASFRQEGMEEVHRVTARGTNTEPFWEISDPDNDALDGRYLGRENLCECEVTPEGSGFEITAEFKCRKRDLMLTEIEPRGWPWSTNKEKLALTVVATALGKTLGGLEQDFPLCRSQLTASGEQDEQDVDT